MFRAGETIRHRNCLDIDLYIHKIQYSSPTYVKVRVSYMLRKGGWILGTETVKILRKDFKNWDFIHAKN